MARPPMSLMGDPSPADGQLSCKNGFTLVEMLVSAVVLVLLVVMVVQLTNGATATTTNSRKHMDADSQARLIFDRMSNDFDKMAKRKDVDYIFYKNYVTSASAPGQNDAMFFYSEVPAYYDSAPASAEQSTAALTGYRINSNNPYYPGVPVLERLGKGLTWDGATNNSTSGPSPVPGGPVLLTTPSGSATPVTASLLDGNWTTIGSAANGYSEDSLHSYGNDTDYHVLGEQVYRLEIAFLLNDGTISTIPVINPLLSPPTAVISGTNGINDLMASAPPTVMSDSNNDDGNGSFAPGSRWFNNSPGGRGYICITATPGAAIWQPIGVQDISAVIVAIAILDANSRKIVSNYSQLSGALPDPVGSGSAPTQLSGTQTMAYAWTSLISSGTFAQACGIPRAAASQVRIYQRYFYLN